MANNDPENEITEAEALAMYTDLFNQAEAGDNAAMAQIIDLIDSMDYLFYKALKNWLLEGAAK